MEKGDTGMSAKETIHDQIALLQPELESYPGLWEIFERCFMNTIETTVKQEQGDTFVITGDIPAMWLRDSTAQVLHYLRFAENEVIAKMIEGLIARQTDCIMHDPYANAFNKEPSDFKPYNDTPRANDWVWERKYEIDSLCYPLWLAEKYLDKTGRTEFLNDDFGRMMYKVVEVLRTEQNHSESEYRFERTNCPPSDTLPNGGMGAPVAYTQMTWSGFRPSDDACKYGYLIPSNLFAVRALKAAKKLAEKMGDEELAKEAGELADRIAEGVQKHGVVEHAQFGSIYAYEVDGLGNVNLMDDANVPSLLALPYLEVCDKEDELYRNTRAFVLSCENPYFYQGTLARGVGSPHPPPGFIWPIALCVQGMTSTDENEIAGILNALMNTHADTGFMHESFHPDKPELYTRSWFAWANSMFGELIYRLYEDGRLQSVLDKAMNMRAM